MLTLKIRLSKALAQRVFALRPGIGRPYANATKETERARRREAKNEARKAQARREGRLRAARELRRLARLIERGFLE